jgi:hypothetical protein
MKKKMLNKILKTNPKLYEAKGQNSWKKTFYYLT